MSLIACAGCGKQVSEQAPSCPNCGHPIAIPQAVAPQKGAVEQRNSRRLGPRGWVLLLLFFGGGLALYQTGLGGHLFNRVRQSIDSQRILGKWELQGTSSTLEFFSDGTLREERLLNTGKGTYKLRPNHRIELDVEGVLWGRNQADFRYEISGEELLLTTDAGVGITLRFRKVD